MTLFPYYFDETYYLQMNPDVANSPHFGPASGQGARHYFNFGRQEGRSPNPFFDPSHYLNRHQDLIIFFSSSAFTNDAERFIGIEGHWRDHGIDEGRSGSPIFDPAFYLSAHRDLVMAFGPRNFRAAYEHWMEFGINEGRRSVPEINAPILGSPRAPSILETVTALRLPPGSARRILEIARDTVDWIIRGLTIRDVLREVSRVPTESERVLEALENFDMGPTIFRDDSTNIPGHERPTVV